MSEFRGTKGKWEIKDSTKIVIGKQPICDTWYFGKINIEEAKCNAKLIACAPDMLEMLKIMGDALLELMNHQDGWEDDYEKLKQLIKKATEL